MVPERGDGKEKGFTDPANWETFDLTPAVTDRPGYASVVTVGGDVYFIPFFASPGANQSVAVRYETSGDFADPESWTTFDVGESIVVEHTGYGGGVSDGRYCYLAPANDGGIMHGEVVRYDTRSEFTDPDAWMAFDPGRAGVGDDPDGYEGNPAFDGRYVYFAPHMHDAGDPRGEVLRYDTRAEFADPGSWTVFDPVRVEHEDDVHGFYGTVFDGRYVHFLPFNADDEGGLGGELVRYDTGRAFDDPASWSAFDPRKRGVGEEGVAITDGAFDGRYLYLPPARRNGPVFGGAVLRYDTRGALRDRSSWSVFGPAEEGVVTDRWGYFGAVAHERYVYFSPGLKGAGRGAHCEVLRYDIRGEFTEPRSWTVFDPGAAGVGERPGGYTYATVADGHLYFAPLATEFGDGHVDTHGEVLRYVLPESRN